MHNTIEASESAVRGYARLFPRVFDKARGSELWDEDGRRYIDFFCGAGSLNYGHNNPLVQSALLDYISNDGIQLSLDMATRAKIDLIEAFQEIILRPRGFQYKLQFTGPTGSNAVEAAIKLARRYTRRSHIVAFTRGYHGHSLGALSLTGNQYFHSEFDGSHNNVSHLPYDNYVAGLDSAELLDKLIRDPSSGLPLPAAVILETVQGEGGVRVASDAWLRRVSDICRTHGILLIVDDIQVGNGRTGTFFSFEPAQITPDLVCLSKSIGGGLPLSLLLIAPEIDVWQPGQHTGTFRGNNLAFVAGRVLLDYWKAGDFQSQIVIHSKKMHGDLVAIADRYSDLGWEARGRGMIQALDVKQGRVARAIIDHCFASGLLIEASGADDEVLKLMPALTTPTELLCEGLHLLEKAIAKSVGPPINPMPLPLDLSLPLTHSIYMGNSPQ